MSYQDDVKERALYFVKENEGMVREGIKDGNDSIDDHRDFYDYLHEQVTDRSYTIKDAAVILSECTNEETDKGLWEGQSPSDAIVTMAAYSFANDVRSDIGDFYTEIKEKFDEKLSDLETALDELEERADEGEELSAEERTRLDGRDDLDLEEEAMGAAWQEFLAEQEAIIVPIEPGSEEEKSALNKWFSLGSKAGMWSGYPIGESYIDTRVGSGHGIPEVKDYVDYDHIVAAQLPHLAGKYKNDVQAYYDEQFGRGKQITDLAAAMELIGNTPEAIAALADATLRSQDLKAALGIASESLSKYFEAGVEVNKNSEINLYDAFEEAANKWWPDKGVQYGNFSDVSDFAAATRTLLKLGDRDMELSAQATALIANATDAELAPLFEKWKEHTEQARNLADAKKDGPSKTAAANLPEDFKKMMSNMLSPDAKKDQGPDHEDDLERD